MIAVLLRAVVILSLCLPMTGIHAAAAPAQPRLVVVMVVDGLPSEQVLRYREQFGQGGFRRLLEQGAWFSNAHQAHGVTVTAVGHAAILTGAYPYRHGIIENNWIDPASGAKVYCAEDPAHTYLDEHTDAHDGTSPANLRVSTLGDELRYASGNRSKVVTVSGKDRGAILLAGKSGTAYMYMENSGNFASSSYYMQAYPDWVRQLRAARAQDRYAGKRWELLLPESAYSGDSTLPKKTMPLSFGSAGAKPDAAYYKALKGSPFLDEMTLDFAKAAVVGEQLGRNPAGVTDLLGVSLSAHDLINHEFGPESRMSHDHLQRLDRMLASFFGFLDQRVGLDNVLIVMTADHGFPNVPEYAKARGFDAGRLDSEKMLAALEQHLGSKFGIEKLVKKSSTPNIYLDYAAAERRNIRREEVENAAARFLLGYDGIADVFTRTQLENGIGGTRTAVLMRRAWNRQLSGDLVTVPKPFWIYSSGGTGTSHGTPYAYDTSVPLMIMGKPWVRPGAYGQYAEVVDLAPTLAHLLRLRPPAAAEGRVLVETLR